MRKGIKKDTPSASGISNPNASPAASERNAAAD
jgi:hypothetical protein